MPWTVTEEKKYKKNVDKLGEAELRKVNEWTDYVEQNNTSPSEAAKVLGYKVGPGPKPYYEFYAGSYHRVFFTSDGTKLVLTLHDVGHVRD
jgi:mRNA-degrading endonuclease RelE of RelBE toxin-antitoxin system